MNANLVTPVIDNFSDAKVNGLINDSGDWDHEVLQDLFLPADIDRILATPISPHIKDTWYWKGDSRGIYSVRHGYHMLTNSYLTVDPHLQFTEWQRLWVLPILPKVKNFLWRCMRNVLPVREILKTKHVWASGGCPFCTYDRETMEHHFCLCPMVNQVWNGSIILNNESLALMLNRVLCGPSLGEAACMWAIWNARNNLIWKEVTFSSIGLKQQVASYCELWNLNYSKVANTTNVVQITSVWVPPQVNVDAAIFSDGVGYGAIIRDHTGRFVSSQCPD
ncbi:PREDICTED: uncharacterized protein LOC109154171 [Ipomoea nil]|uniref:uncharacterized protein LOC109154171 n=1 Tax=Ipomoea nil TaxID=35883 RepID=UPI000901E3B3|nr:PREDICTED: uncharacterized protein LOC109154171 [Ipomoea nil]